MADTERFKSLMQTAYTTLAKYYDLIFSSKDYKNEASFIEKIVKRRNPQSKSILDIGCGTGTHLNLLREKFNILHGVDLSPEIIKEAKRKSSKITYSIGKMANFNLKRKFDVLISLYSVFNYNLSIEEAKKTLINFRRHLKPNGLIILALYTPTNTEKQISLHMGKKAGVEVVKINEFSTDEKTNIQTSNFLVLLKDRNGVDFFTEPNHKYKIYNVDEFTYLMKKAGFKGIEVFDNFTDKPVSSKTKYPVFVANS